MKIRAYVTVLIMFSALAFGVSFAQDCEKLGARDCKPGSQPGACFWRECRQVGPLMQMVFTQEKCPCPRAESETNKPPIKAQCPNQKLVEDVEECSLAMQSSFQFEAYVTPDCKVHVKGDPKRRNRSYAAFDGCLSSRGQPIKGWEREK